MPRLALPAFAAICLLAGSCKSGPGRGDLTGEWTINLVDDPSISGVETFGPDMKLDATSKMPSDKIPGGVLEIRVTGTYEYAGGKLSRRTTYVEMRAPNADAVGQAKMVKATITRQADLLKLYSNPQECYLTWTGDDTFETVESGKKHIYRRKTGK